MKREYKYLIKYNFRGGIGVLEWVYSKPITSFADIKTIKDHIESKYNLKNVGIENYTLVAKRENVRKFIK